MAWGGGLTSTEKPDDTEEGIQGQSFLAGEIRTGLAGTPFAGMDRDLRRLGPPAEAASDRSGLA